MEFLSLKRKTFYELAELNKHTSVPLVKVDERSLKRLKTDERGSKRLKTDSCSYLSFNKCELSTDDVEQRTERIMFKDHEIKKESDTLIDIQTLQKDSEVSKSLHQDVIHEENQSRCSMMLEKHQIKKEVIPLEVTASDTNIGSKLRESMHQEYSSEERVVENGSKCSKMLEKYQIKKEVLPLDGMEKDINIGLKVSVEDEPKADERTEHSGRKLALENLHNPKITKGDINIGSKVGIKLEIKAEPQRYEHNEQNGRELVMENLCKLWINDCKIENGAVKLETNSNINSMNAFQGNVCKQELDISEEFESWDDGNVSEIQSSLIKKEKVPEMNEIESSENMNAVDMKAKSREKNLIPGQQFILGIRGAHASGKSIFNCVLCFGSAVESSQNGPMFKRHIRSRQHALRVMEVENYPLYLEYKDSLLLDPELIKVILDYEDSQGRQTMVLATLLNYKKKRNTIEKKILLMKKKYPRLDLHHTVQSSTKDTNDRGTRSPCNRPSKVQESLSIKIDRESDSPCDNTSKVQEPILVKIGRGNGSPCSCTSKVQEPLSANTDRGTGSPCGGNPSKDQEPLSANVNGSPCDKVKETLSFKDNGGALVENSMGSRGVGYFGSVTSDVRSSPGVKKIERGEFAGQKKLKGEIIFNNNVDVSAVTSHNVTNELDCVIVEMEETANCHSKDTQEHRTKATKSDSDYEEEGIEEKTKKNSRKKIIEEQRMEGVAKSLRSVNPVDESSQRYQIDQIVIIGRKFCFKALSSIISDKVKVLNLKTLTLNSLLKHVNEMRRKRFLRKTLWLFTVGCAEWFETRPFYQCLINDPRCSTPLRFISLSTRMNNVEKFVDKVVKRVERMTAGVRATLPSDSFFFVLPPMPLILYQFTMGRTHLDLHSRMRGCPYQCYVTMESERKKVLPAFRKLSDRISRLSIEGVDRSPFSPGVFEEYRSRVPMVDVETVASLGSGPALFKHWVTCISTFANQVFESGLCRSTSSMNGQPEPKSLSATFPRSPESCTLDVRPERKSSFSVTIPRSPEPRTHDGQPEPKSSLSAAFPSSPESCTLDVRTKQKSSFSVIPRSPEPHTHDGQPEPKSSLSAAFPRSPESCTPDVRPEPRTHDGQPKPKSSLSAAFPRSPESCTPDVRPERKSSFSVTIPRSPEPRTHDGQPEPKSSLSAAFPRSPESCTLDVRPERKSSFSVIPRSPKPHTLDGQPKPKSSISAAFPTLPESCTPDVRPEHPQVIPRSPEPHTLDGQPKPKSSISAAFPTLPESCTPDVRPEHPQVIPRSPEPHTLDGQPEPKLSLSAAFPRSPESCILNVQPERKSSLSVTFPRSPKPPFHVGQRSGTPEEHLIFLGSSKILKQIPSSENSAVSHWILQFPVDWPALNLQMSLESSSGPSLSFVILLDISAIGRKVPYRGCQELKCQNTIYFTSIEPSCCKLIKKRLAAVGKVIRAITKRYEGCNVVLVPPPPCCCILESTLTMKVRDRHAFLHKMMNSELGPELVSGGTKKKWREAVNVLVRRVENFAGVLKSECMAGNALMSNFASRWGAIEWVKGDVNQRVLPHSQLFLRELVRVLENGPRKSLLEFNRTLDEWIVSLTSKPPIGGTFEHAVLVGREGIFSPLRGLRGVTTMTVDLNSVDRDRFLWGLGSLPPDAVLFLGFELDAFLGEPSGLRSCKLNGCRSPIRVFGSRSILDRASVDYKVKTLVEFCEALRAIAPAVVVLLPLCPDKVYLLKEGVVSHEDKHSRLMGKRFVVCGDKEDWEGWLGYVVEAWNSRVKGFHGRDPILRVLPEYPVPGLTFRVVDSSLKDYDVESEGYWTWIWSYVWSLLVCLLRNGKSLLEAPARGSRDRANHVEPHSIGVSTWWGKKTTEDWSRCSKSVASGIGAAIEGNLPSHDILPNREVPKASSLAGLLTPHSLPNGKTLNASSLTFRFTQDNILPNREAPKGLFRTPHDIPRNREAHKASSLTPHDIFDAMRKGIHSMEELYLEVRMGEVKRPWRMEDTEQWIQECLRVGYCAVSVRRLPVEVKVPAGQALSWVNLYMAAAGAGGGFRSWNTYHDLDGVWTLVVNGRLLDDVLESARQGVCNLMMTEIRLVDLRVRKVARTGATLPVEMTKVDRATSPTPPRTPLLGLMRPTPMLCDPYLQRNQTQGLLAVGGLCGEGETPPRFIIPRSVYYNW